MLFGGRKFSKLDRRTVAGALSDEDGAPLMEGGLDVSAL